MKEPDSERRPMMKVLTATNQTQGWRKGDFCWTVEGELVLSFLRSSVDAGASTTTAAVGARWLVVW